MSISLEEAGRLHSLANILDYQNMPNGMPILQDYQGLIESSADQTIQGNRGLVSLVSVDGTPRIQLSIPYASLLQDKAAEALVAEEMGNMKVTTLTPYMQRHLWYHPTEWARRDGARRSPPLVGAANPIIGLQNFGDPGPDRFDTALDVFIFDLTQEGNPKILVIQRGDIGKCKDLPRPNYAILGGMLSRGSVEKQAIINQSVIEFLEEGISDSIIQSSFYRENLEQAFMFLANQTDLPVDKREDTEAQTLKRSFLGSKAGQTFLNSFHLSDEVSISDQFAINLSRLSEDDSPSGHERKAHFAIAALDAVDIYQKSFNHHYQTCREYISSRIQPINNPEIDASEPDRQLIFRNLADHRATPEGAAKSRVHVLTIDDTIYHLFRERGLNFSGGTDALNISPRSIEDVLEYGWGGHSEMLITMAIALEKTDNTALTPEQVAIKQRLLPAINAYLYSPRFANKMERMAQHLLNGILAHEAYLKKNPSVRQQLGLFGSEDISEFVRTKMAQTPTPSALEILHEIVNSPAGQYQGAKETLKAQYHVRYREGKSVGHAINCLHSHVHEITSTPGLAL